MAFSGPEWALDSTIGDRAQQLGILLTVQRPRLATVAAQDEQVIGARARDLPDEGIIALDLRARVARLPAEGMTEQNGPGKARLQLAKRR